MSFCHPACHYIFREWTHLPPLLVNHWLYSHRDCPGKRWPLFNRNRAWDPQNMRWSDIDPPVAAPTSLQILPHLRSRLAPRRQWPRGALGPSPKSSLALSPRRSHLVLWMSLSKSDPMTMTWQRLLLVSWTWFCIYSFLQSVCSNIYLYTCRLCSIADKPPFEYYRDLAEERGRRVDELAAQVFTLSQRCEKLETENDLLEKLLDEAKVIAQMVTVRNKRTNLF